jgi:hypothetical protein
MRPSSYSVRFRMGRSVSSPAVSRKIRSELFGVGNHRGKPYIPLQHPDGTVAPWLDAAASNL